MFLITFESTPLERPLSPRRRFVVLNFSGTSTMFGHNRRIFVSNLILHLYVIFHYCVFHPFTLHSLGSDQLGQQFCSSSKIK